MKAIILCGALMVACSAMANAEWTMNTDQLVSRWAAEVTPENVWPEHPRPTMVRETWQHLNGLWDYAIVPVKKDAPKKYDGKILVPFAAESALSGVKKAVGAENQLWYRRSFEVPEAWQGQRLLLHFGAVDWKAVVWVNGEQLGVHCGGYDPFYFDITDALKEGRQEVVVSVWDPTDDGYQPRGKQVHKPEGIWYTAVTGVWQSVWLEAVPETSIRSLRITPDIDAETVIVNAGVAVGQTGDAVEVQILDGGTLVAKGACAMGQDVVVPLPNPKLWSPDTPFLYNVKVSVTRAGTVRDTVSSYVGMRKIALGKDDAGRLRLFLNNKPLFQYGPLDQGWWPDGLYTAPSDAALRYDVEATRNMGFNMARKHVKVEPARWYYHCDQLGLLVWQDMPSGDRYIGKKDPDIVRTAESERNFYQEFQGVIDFLFNHPSIVMWVPFNEGWGQFDTNEVAAWTKRYDPSRLVNSTSGWTDRGGSDVIDKHSYPGPDMFPLEAHRASVLGEFGGLGWPVEGHLWWDKRNWGYRNLSSQEELREGYATLIFRLRSLIGQGLAAAIYTQTTDVEGEVNGLMTYDRAVVKMGLDWLKECNDSLYLPPPTVRTLVPTSEKEGQRWRYTTQDPGEAWAGDAFDDQAWPEGPGVLGTKGTPGAVVRTTWDTPEIWARRTFQLDTVPTKGICLWINHDENALVYINGKRVAALKGFSSAYVLVPLDEKEHQTLKQGENLLAVHCKQTKGGQCIDIGLVIVEEK
jgi:hypothetical protein